LVGPDAWILPRRKRGISGVLLSTVVRGNGKRSSLAAEEGAEDDDVFPLLIEGSAELGPGAGMVERDKPAIVPSDGDADGAQRCAMGGKSGERAKGDGAEGDHNEGIDGIDCPLEVIAAIGDFGGGGRAVFAIVARVAEHRVGDEHLVVPQSRGPKQGAEGAACAVAGERNAASLAAEAARGFGNEEDCRPGRAVRRREETPASLHGRAAPARLRRGDRPVEGSLVPPPDRRVRLKREVHRAEES
jgi:hypothetical protein